MSTLCTMCTEPGHVMCWAEHPAVGCPCCQATMREIRRLRKTAPSSVFPETIEVSPEA